MRDLSITIKVEMLAGTSIQAACIDLCELSRRIGANSEVSFNGIPVIARPDTDANELINEYGRVVKTDDKFKMVMV